MIIDRRERIRRRDLVHAHMAAEEAQDIDAIMATFASNGVMIFNGVPFATPDAIIAGHVQMGMTKQPGAFDPIKFAIDRESESDDYHIVEATVVTRSVGPLFGYPATGKPVSLYYAAAYRFDPAGKLVSEHVVLNFGPVALPYALSVAAGNP